MCDWDILVNQFSPTFLNLLICLLLMIIINRGENCNTSECLFASTWRARETTERLFSIPSWSKPCWWRSVLLDVVTYHLRSFFFGDRFLGNIIKFSKDRTFLEGKPNVQAIKGFFFSNKRNSPALLFEMHRYFYLICDCHAWFGVLLLFYCFSTSSQCA